MSSAYMSNLQTFFLVEFIKCMFFLYEKEGDWVVLSFSLSFCHHVGFPGKKKKKTPEQLSD